MPPPLPRRAAAFLGALALDSLLGDPPTVLHPVGWLGRAVGVIEAAAPKSPGARRVFGVASAAAVPVIAGALAGVCARRSRAGLVAEVLMLDGVFALHTLLARAGEVRVALEQEDLEHARALLGRHLVSRDTRDLSAGEVAGAAIESVAENLGDGVIGPWLAYAALGLPGAAAYRAVNTLDSMWGYRTDEYRDLGWGSARLDDIVNIAPARVAALAIVGAAYALHEDGPAAFEVWRRDAAATESPNAGHPMAAMAGALGVVLTKRGAYRLGGRREPRAEDIARAVDLARCAALGTAAALILVLLADGERGR